MALSDTPLTETSAFTAAIYPPKPNSAVLSNDVEAGEQALANRTRFLYNGGPFPKGMTITQSVANGNGVTATANGTGDGVVGTGGASSGAGGSFTGGATDGIGVEGFGTGSGRGGAFQGGLSGAGVIAQGGGSNAPGVQAQADGTGPAVECLTGGVKFSGGQPAITDNPGTNTIHATGACKAWALITTDGAGNVTVVDGLNIASASILGTVLTVNMVNGFASAAYAVFPASGNAPVSNESVTYEWNRGASSGTAIVLYGRRHSAGAVSNIDFTSTSNVVLVEVRGRQ